MGSDTSSNLLLCFAAVLHRARWRVSMSGQCSGQTEANRKRTSTDQSSTQSPSIMTAGLYQFANTFDALIVQASHGRIVAGSVVHQASLLRIWSCRIQEASTSASGCQRSGSCPRSTNTSPGRPLQRTFRQQASLSARPTLTGLRLRGLRYGFNAACDLRPALHSCNSSPGK